MTGRPLPLRLLPLWVRQRVYYRFYSARAERYAHLFASAPLAFAPRVMLTLEPTDVAHQAIALAGVYEHDVSRRIARMARQGGLLVDVGANYGYYSCLWASLHSDNRVIAFEALDANISALRANAERNDLSARIEAHPLAVGREAGTLAFRLGARAQTGQGGFAGRGEATDTSVPVCTLDSFFANRPHEQIDVLKIDAEGADTWVLEGASSLLEAGRIRHVFFEQYPARMAALGVPRESARGLLERAGYRVRQLAGDEWYAEGPA